RADAIRNKLDALAQKSGVDFRTNSVEIIVQKREALAKAKRAERHARMMDIRKKILKFSDTQNQLTDLLRFQKAGTITAKQQEQIYSKRKDIRELIKELRTDYRISPKEYKEYLRKTENMNIAAPLLTGHGQTKEFIQGLRSERARKNKIQARAKKIMSRETKIKSLIKEMFAFESENREDEAIKILDRLEKEYGITPNDLDKYSLGERGPQVKPNFRKTPRTKKTNSRAGQTF
ncbi:MAG: hypothetical protein AABY11_02885, partial [archaeon]